MLIAEAKNIRSITLDNGDKETLKHLSIGAYSYINSLEFRIATNNDLINVQVGNYTSIGHSLKLLIDRNHDYKGISTCGFFKNDFNIPDRTVHRGEIIIGHDVWIGNNVTIMSGIRIGNGAIIGTEAVVTKDVPHYGVVVGNPPRMIKYRFDQKICEKANELQWWNWEYEEIGNKMSESENDMSRFVLDNYIEKKPFVKRIDSGMPQNNVIIFQPDFDDNYPIWERIFKSYVDFFSAVDDIVLVLAIEDELNYSKNLDKFNQIVDESDDIPDIIIYNRSLDDGLLFQYADYYITTRSIKTMRYIDYADQYNVEIISGFNIPLFIKDKSEYIK